MARIPRIPNRSDVEKLDLRKRPAPVGRKEALHERMERELTNLKRDRRFWEGDKAYQRYVQRQFERVYNDPSGESQPLRIGSPKIFATDIEPFGSMSGQRKSKQGSDSKAPGLDMKQRTENRVLPVEGVKPDHSNSKVDERSSAQEKASDLDRELRSERLAPLEKQPSTREEPSMSAMARDILEVEFAGGDTDLEQAQASAAVMLEKFDEYGWDTATRLFLHYQGGSGEQVTIPSDVVIDYPTLQGAHRRVLWNFGRWFVGDIEDTKFGKAPLPLNEGDRTTLGVQLGEQGLSFDDVVMWETTFLGAGGTLGIMDKFALDDEAHSSVGGGTLQGFASSLTLVRDDDTIRISGVMEFRVEDTYKFEDGHWLHYDELERAGLAKSFTVISTPWSHRVSGLIRMDGDEPVSALMWIVGEPQLRVRFPGEPNPVNPRSIRSTQ